MLSKNILFLDIGSYSLKGILVNEKNFTIIVKDVQENPGIKNGYIANGEIFEEALKSLIKKIEKKSRIKITNIVLLVGSHLIKYKVLISNMIKVKRIIDNQIMHHINSQINNWINENDAILINASNIEYILDGISVENPINLYANKMQFTYLLTYANITQLGSLIYILEKNKLDVIEILPSIFCNASLYLSEDERKLGSLIFDIGAQNINWAYYMNNKPINAGVINFGSEIITNKIAKSLKITISEAQKLKHSCVNSNLLSQDFCQWTEFIKNDNTEFILESEITRKILPEIDILIEHIHKIIYHFSSKAYLAVLCGHGAWLNRLVNVIQKNISITIKLTPSASPEFDALHGALVSYQQNKKIIAKKQRGIFKKIIDWFKNL